jgi:hypothetical protein
MKIYNVGRSALVCLLTAALVAYGGSRAYPASVRGEHLSGTTAHLLESCRSVDAIPTHLRPQSQTDRAGFDAVFDCSTEKSYIHVAAACGLIVSNTTM